MKHDLIKIFGEQRAESIKKYQIKQQEQTILNSTIFTEFSDDPIYITHVTLPSLLTNYDELKNLRHGKLGSGGNCIDGKIYIDIDNEIHEDLLGNFYAEWNPIDYISLLFTNLQPTNVLGDITLLSARGVFKLTNVSIDEDEKRMFYDEAILID